MHLRRFAITTAAAACYFWTLDGSVMTERSFHILDSSVSLGDWFLYHRWHAQLAPGFVGILLAQLLPDRSFKNRDLL